MRCMITSFALCLPVAASLTAGAVAVAQTPGPQTEQKAEQNVPKQVVQQANVWVGTFPVAWKERFVQPLTDALKDSPNVNIGFYDTNNSAGFGLQIKLWGPADAVEIAKPKIQTLYDKLMAEAKPFTTAMYQLRDVSFKGGGIREFLSTILPQGVQVNVLFQNPALSSVTLPALRVQHVSGYTALELMTSLLSEPSAGDARGINFEFVRKEGEMPRADPMEQGDAVTLMVRQNIPRGASAPDASEPAVLRIMSADAESPAAREEQRKQQDRVLRAIDDAMEFKGGPSQNFRVKLNADTGILFVAGSQQERATVAAVVAAIMNPPGKAAQTRDADPAAAVPAAGAAGTTGTTGDRKSANTPATRGQQQQPR